MLNNGCQPVSLPLQVWRQQLFAILPAAFNVFIIGSNMAGKILFLVLAVPSLETRKELLVLFLYFLIFGIFFLLATGSANGG